MEQQAGAPQQPQHTVFVHDAVDVFPVSCSRCCSLPGCVDVLAAGR